MEGLTNYEKEIRPWGEFERFTLNEKTTIKLLTVAARESLSQQEHEHRDEFWRILAGSGTVQIEDRQSAAKAGDTFFTPRHESHRIEAGPDGLTFLEIAFGEFDEHDETRLDDKYGRA